MRRRRLLAAGIAPLPWPSLAAPARATGDGTLRLAFSAAESSLDPPQTNSSLYSTTVLAQILESPLTYDYLARPVRLMPCTAAAMPEVSADGRRFVFRLQPGIFFADDPAFKGTKRELVAEDYVYSLKRYYDPRWKSSDLYLLENAKIVGMDEVRKKALAGAPFDYDRVVPGLRSLDRYTFVVELGEPDPRFVYNFASAGSFGAVAREVVEHYGEAIGEHPVGTGPFRLGAWRRASRIELLRSPSHRGTPYAGTPADDPAAQAIAAALRGRRLPLADRVVVDIVEENQPRWLAFLNGQHDWLELPSNFAPMAMPGGQLAPYLTRRGIRAQRSLQSDMTMHYFNMLDPVVGGYTPEKVALRRAISLAYDGAREIAQVRGGMAIPAQSTIAPHTSGYDPAYRSEMSEHNLARANALLDLYGYADRNRDGWRERPDGTPFTLRFATQSDQVSRSLNELWKRALDGIGVRVQFEVSTWPELLKKTRTASLQIWGYGWTAQSPDGGFFLAIAYGPNADESNDARFALPEFDRLFEQQRRLPDGPEREALIRQAKDLLVAYMPYKAHVHRIMTDLMQPWLRHWWRHPFMRNQWQYLEVQGRPAA